MSEVNMPGVEADVAVSGRCDQEQEPWPIRLFEKSPLKQEKLQQILRLIGEPVARECLDVGSDNGVISYLLRERGRAAGEIWHSCDLIPETVESIRSLVGERVDQIDGLSTPYSTEHFDLVVIVDLLEHIETDREFINEVYRILKPGGSLIVNVPNPKEGILRRFRSLIGQTDQAHGHLRPGYTLEEIEELLGDGFVVESSQSYSRLFSVLIDTLITAALDFLKKSRGGEKGTVVTGGDMKKMEKSFKLYSALFPLIKIFVELDRLFSFLRGNMLIVKVGKSRIESELKGDATVENGSFLIE